MVSSSYSVQDPVGSWTNLTDPMKNWENRWIFWGTPSRPPASIWQSWGTIITSLECPGPTPQLLLVAENEPDRYHPPTAIGHRQPPVGGGGE